MSARRGGEGVVQMATIIPRAVVVVSVRSLLV